MEEKENGMKHKDLQAGWGGLREEIMANMAEGLATKVSDVTNIWKIIAGNCGNYSFISSLCCMV